jgi:phosphatidylinositol glycan class U
MCHVPPLVLALYYWVGSAAMPWLHVAVDLVTAWLLAQCVRLHSTTQARELDEERDIYARTAAAALEPKSTVNIPERIHPHLPAITAAIYLWNPYSFMQCVTMATTSIHNFTVVVALYAALRGNRLWMTWGCALATYLTLYPIVLLIALHLLLERGHCPRLFSVSTSSLRCRWWLSLGNTFLLYFIHLLVLLLLSYLSLHSWEFLWKVYGPALWVTDLQPNLGLWWYFFTELFSHFRPFFLFVFHYNLFIYTLPLTLRLQNHPELILWVLLASIATFKPYPVLGDIALHLAILPLLSHKLRAMRYTFVVACGFVYVSILIPILWRMWIYTGTGNANFYYALNLALAILQLILISDVVSAVQKREFLMKIQRRKLGADVVPNSTTQTIKSS